MQFDKIREAHPRPQLTREQWLDLNGTWAFAYDCPKALEQPRGKQDWRDRPHAIWYKRTTGIWQPVWLEPVMDTYVTELRWTSDADQGLLRLDVRLNDTPDKTLRLRTRLWLRDRLLVDDSYRATNVETHRDVVLEATDVNRVQELLWSPKYPNLIEAELTLYDGEAIIDDVHSYAGLRSVGFADGRFLLNGLPYYLRMALEQGSGLIHTWLRRVVKRCVTKLSSPNRWDSMACAFTRKWKIRASYTGVTVWA
jgi:hypothetical protein